MDRPNNLLEVLEELERRERSRHMNRYLRDTSDPFLIPEEHFRKLYRLSREAARTLYLELSQHMDIGRRVTKIPSVVRFITALHFFAQGSYQKSVGKDQHCSVSQSEVSNSLHEIINILVEHAAANYIRFPRNVADVTRVKTGFFEKFGFPGILGCIDGTHVLIVPPPAVHDIYPGRIYINRNHRHSLNCQIICDSDLNILSINARFPGSVHDSAIWMMSGVKQILRDNYTNRGDRSTWLLGDSGYPLEPFLLTPIEGANPQTPEGRYTRAHKTVRNCVERCIGVLKSYFRCLHKDRVLHYTPVTAAKIVYACAILHNILRMRNIVDDNIEIRTGEEEPNPLPCLVYVHGESYEWNSGNPYDGTMLASAGRVIVVTINFRLGVLGFLKTGAKGSAQGNFGLMDLVAGLHWLRENLPAFGGDPERVTLMGHSTGAALVNFIAVSPVAKELLHRVVLLSGSGLSPWALQRDPLSAKRRVAEDTGCHGDLLEDDMAPCLRLKPLEDLLSVKVHPPRFLPGFAPFIDGTILVNPTNPPPTTSSATVATSAGFELADFPERDLLFGLTSTESYLDLSAQDLEFGFNETRRDRILRTYVRNSYYYHLNEIFSTLKNEYTDWEKPMQNPLSVRDATLEVLSDGHTAAPLIRIGYLHSLRGGKTFFLHFLHQSGERDFPQRTGSVRGEDIPYILGLPLVGGGPFFPHNYSHGDAVVAKMLIHYISNFARKGDPNGAIPTSAVEMSNKSLQKDTEEVSAPFWDTYDTINQLYLELGNRPEMRNHYRGHKMSLWLNLIPQLHRPSEGDETSMRHHHFQEEGDQYYDGSVREQTNQKPSLVHIIAPPPAPTTPRAMLATTTTTQLPPKSDTALQATTTECPPNHTTITPINKISSNSNNLLKKLATSHYQSYTTALTVTIAVGCFLLLLNILIFAGIYHQRDRTRNKQKKKEELAEAGSCSSSSGENYESKSAMYEAHQIGYESCKSSHELSRATSFEHKPSNFIGEYSYEKQSLDTQMPELPLQEFKSSPPPGVKRAEGLPLNPPSYSPEGQSQQNVTSPSIPEPPPPPKNQPPNTGNQVGILRPHGAPTTPGTMKKRVQIQEISV